MADVREGIADALQGTLTPEQIRSIVDEALAVKKKGSAEFNCKKCGAAQKQVFEYSDVKAVLAALELLANQSWGRPGEAARSQSQVVFTRVINPPAVYSPSSSPHPQTLGTGYEELVTNEA